jgi:isoquinoline 1-oxidoreductase alpha subunit
MVTIVVNGVRREITAPTDTPLLYVLRNDLELSGPQFGCGLSQCGACSVLLDGKEVRSCTMPLSAAAGKEVTTLEGLPARWAKQKGLPPADAAKTLHPVQAAWIEEQTPLCGFCQNGMMIKATELLEHNASPTLAEIKEAFTTLGPSAHLCRCGSYTAIIDAVRRAGAAMGKG